MDFLDYYLGENDLKIEINKYILVLLFLDIPYQFDSQTIALHSIKRYDTHFNIPKNRVEIVGALDKYLENFRDDINDIFDYLIDIEWENLKIQ